AFMALGAPGSAGDLAAALAGSTAMRYQTSLREQRAIARAHVEPRIDAIWRWPDFFSVSVNVAIPNPWTGTLLGATGAATLDENGELYVGAGGSVGSSLTLISGSAAFGWLNQAAPPTAPQLQRFLAGRGFNASAGYWIGGAYSYTIETGESSTSLGFFSPQAGVGYTYSWHVGDLWD
ncbi:MAG TPA: hypothetical protein VEC18_12080, partial [Myxococcota bacterium]|nr:hypothetical protein [Myxococcota bacterium]